MICMKMWMIVSIIVKYYIYCKHFKKVFDYNTWFCASSWITATGFVHLSFITILVNEQQTQFDCLVSLKKPSHHEVLILVLLNGISLLYCPHAHFPQKRKLSSHRKTPVSPCNDVDIKGVFVCLLRNLWLSGHFPCHVFAIWDNYLNSRHAAI